MNEMNQSRSQENLFYVKSHARIETRLADTTSWANNAYTYTAPPYSWMHLQKSLEINKVIFHCFTVSIQDVGDNVTIPYPLKPLATFNTFPNISTIHSHKIVK